MLKVEMQEPGDAIWTAGKSGQVRVFVVVADGSVAEMNPGEYLAAIKEFNKEEQ